jgi:hypothetical protein
MHILAELTPLDPVGGSRVTLRAASAEDRTITGLNNERWWAAISQKPSMSITLFDGDFSDSINPGSATFTVLIDRLAKLDANAKRFVWAGAGVKLYAGISGQAWPWTQVFEGTVDRFEVRGNAIRITASVDREPFQKNVLTATYAGTGGLEGGADIKNKVKPWVFGLAKNVEPVMINAVDNVFQFSAYGAIKAVNALYERGASFGAATGDHANYAALVAASIPAGRWATCLAEGLIRLGAPPYGVITGDVEGDYQGSTFRRLTGAILTRIATHLSISGSLDTASFTALDSAVNRNVNIVISEQTTFFDLAQRMALPCNGQAGVSFLGKMFIMRVTIGSPSITLDAQGRRLPPVLSTTENDVSPPYKRIEMLADQSWRVHSFDEIAFNAQLLPLGLYDAGTTYREGNIVSLADGSRWVYINPSATAGNAPPNVTYWEALDPSTVATGRNLVLNGSAESNTTDHFSPSEVTGDTILALDTTARSGSKSFSLQKTGGLNYTGAATGRAISVTPGEKLVVRVSVIGSGATATGLYIRMQEKTAAPSSGFVDGTNRSGFTDLIGNGPVSISWVDYEFVYTVPSGITWVSPSVYSWSAAPAIVDFDNIEVFRQTDFSTGVGGAAKPEDYATGNDSMIVNGSLAVNSDHWYSPGAAPTRIIETGQPIPAAWEFPVGPARATYANDGNRIPLAGAKQIWVSGWGAKASGYTSGTLQFVIDWYNASNGYITTSAPDVSLSLTSFSTYIPLQARFDVPTNATQFSVSLYSSGPVGDKLFGVINRVSKTQPAADVTLNSQITVEIPPLQYVAANYTGTVVGTMPVVFSPIVKRNGVSIKSSDDVTYTVTKPSDGTTGADGGTVSVNTTGGAAAKGDVSVSAFATGSALVKFRLNVSVSGIAVGTYECVLLKDVGSPPSGGGSKVAVVQADTSQSTTTYAKTHTAANPQLVVASGEQLYASGTIEYGSDLDSATRFATFKNQYSTDNSTWNDFASAINGSNARAERYDGVDYYPPLTGSAIINQNVNPGAGTYYVRSVWIINSTGATLYGGVNNITFEAKA